LYQSISIPASILFVCSLVVSGCTALPSAGPEVGSSSYAAVNKPSSAPHAVVNVTPETIRVVEKWEPSSGLGGFRGPGASSIRIGVGDVVVFPELAYPTYEVGARYVGAVPVAADRPGDYGDTVPALVYINSPANPNGRILDRDELREIVRWTRAHDVLLVSDECYLDFAWEGTPYSVLHPDVCEGSFEGLLAVHSTSKRSNLAGYRGSFVAGDRAVVAELLAVRKHLGFMMPAPVAAAMTAVLDDDLHVRTQRSLYAARRQALRGALEGAGFTIDDSEGALYLWATRGEACRETVAWLAERGILVAPGEFYGRAGSQHVRVAFTATDERIAAAVARLRT